MDASAVLAVAADEPTKPALIEAVRGRDLIAPSTLPAEIGNALSAMFKRGRIDLPQAERVLGAFRRIPLQLRLLDLERALALADRLGIFAYDAYVLDCAVREGTPLLSLDGGQRDAAVQIGIALHPY